MRVLRPLMAALMAPYAAAQTSEAFSVKCWAISFKPDHSVVIDATAVDAGCPVDVEIPSISAAFAPGDAVPVMWTVALKSASTNDLQMPMPPVAFPTSVLGDQPAQISATYVQSCASVTTCDPTSMSNNTTDFQAGNFSTTGDALVFSSTDELRFLAPGNYPLGAMVLIRNGTDAPSGFVFAAYTTVTVSGGSSSGDATTTHAKGAVRCRMSRQSAANATLDRATSASESSQCEMHIALNPLQVARPNAAVDVSWKATLNPNAAAGLHVPSPPTVFDVNGTGYQIVSSALKVCKTEDACDEYTAAEDLASVILTGPANFSADSTAAFTAKQVKLASTGWHTAMLHLVLAGLDRRFDFLYYFQLLATETDVAAAVEAANYTADGNSSYCWEVLASGTEEAVKSTSVASAAQDGDCPYTLGMSIKSASVSVEDKLDLSWTVSQRSSYSLARFNAVNLTTVYDATTQAWVSLAALHLYACSDGTVCTPFTTNKTLIYSGPARNLTDGKAVINAEALSFPGVGKYRLMAHTVLGNGASRIDTATFASVTVTPASESGSSSKSHTLAYILVAVGSVVAVVAIFFAVVWIRKRRHQQRMDKMVQYGLFGAPGSRNNANTVHKSTESRGSIPSDHTGRGSFSFVKPQPSPVDFMTRPDRTDSLSYDPYARTSFMEMSLDESNLSFAFSDSMMRPSEESTGQVYNV